MKLDHINFTVSDVMEASAFLKRYFGYADAFEDNNADIAVLNDGQGMHINLMRGKDVAYPKTFHIGFDLETEERVNAMHERLKADGLKVTRPKHAWGSWTFNVRCPGGDFIVEVACAKE